MTTNSFELRRLFIFEVTGTHDSLCLFKQKLLQNTTEDLFTEKFLLLQQISSDKLYFYFKIDAQSDARNRSYFKQKTSGSMIGYRCLIQSALTIVKQIKTKDSSDQWLQSLDFEDWRGLDEESIAYISQQQATKYLIKSSEIRNQMSMLSQTKDITDFNQKELLLIHEYIALLLTKKLQLNQFLQQLYNQKRWCDRQNIIDSLPKWEKRIQFELKFNSAFKREREPMDVTIAKHMTTHHVSSEYQLQAWNKIMSSQYAPFVYAVFQNCILKTDKKKQTVWYWGEPDCGKTELIRILNETFYCFNHRSVKGVFSLQADSDFNKKLFDSGMEPQLIVKDESKNSKFFPDKGDLDDVKWFFSGGGLIEREMYKNPFIQYAHTPVIYSSQYLPDRLYKQSKRDFEGNLIGSDEQTEKNRLVDKLAVESRCTQIQLFVNYQKVNGKNPQFPFKWLEFAACWHTLFQVYGNQPELAPSTFEGLFTAQDLLMKRVCPTFPQFLNKNQNNDVIEELKVINDAVQELTLRDSNDEIMAIDINDNLQDKNRQQQRSINFQDYNQQSCQQQSQQELSSLGVAQTQQNHNDCKQQKPYFIISKRQANFNPLSELESTVQNFKRTKYDLGQSLQSTQVSSSLVFVSTSICQITNNSLLISDSNDKQTAQVEALQLPSQQQQWLLWQQEEERKIEMLTISQLQDKIQGYWRIQYQVNYAEVMYEKMQAQLEKQIRQEEEDKENSTYEMTQAETADCSYDTNVLILSYTSIEKYQRALAHKLATSRQLQVV